MQKRIKILNEQTKEVWVMDAHSDEDWALENGYSAELYEVETGYDGSIYLKGYAPTKPIKEVKEEKISEINAERDRLELAGFYYNNYKYDSDMTSTIRINLAKSTAETILNNQLLQGVDLSDEYYVTWTTQNNSTVDLTYAQMIELSIALTAHGSIIHQLASEMKTEVEAFETIDEIQNYQMYFDVYIKD